MLVSRLSRPLAALIVAIAALSGAGGFHAAVGHAPERLRSALAQTAPALRCADLKSGSTQLDVPIGAGGEPLAVGRVLSVNDGTLAVLVIVAKVGPGGAAATVDFSASLKVNAVILRSGSDAEPVAYDPPARNAAGLTAKSGAGIDALSFCYRVAIPAPPALSSPQPTLAAGETRTSVATETPQPTIGASPGVQSAPTEAPVAFDLSGMQTAGAAAAGSLATASAVSGQAALAVATADADSATVRAAATSYAAAANATIDAIGTTQAAATAELAGLRASATADAERYAATAAAQAGALGQEQVARSAAQTEAAVASATIEALQTSLAAPTATPAADQLLRFSASTDAEFSAFTLPEKGWRVGGGLVADGSGLRDWVLLPAVPNLSANYAVEVEVSIDAKGECPRNFGIGVRGSERGFVAAGVEWACDEAGKIWADQKVLTIAPAALQPGWRLFRIEVSGARVRLLVDGVPIAEADGGATAAGSQIAVWSSGVPLTIRAVRVIQLP